MSQEDRLTGLVGFSGMKVPVIAATTAAITLSGEQTIDGIACVTDDRVLVKDQASGVNNGIYVVDTGDWTRAPDADGPFDFVFGTLTPVASGSTNGGAVFRLTTTGEITPGTSSLSFSTMGLLSTPVAIASGGTGASTAAGARTNLDVPSNSEAVLDTIIDAKGDLIVGTAADTPARKAAGTDGYPLVPLAAASDGLAYLPPAAGQALVGGYLAWSVAGSALTVAVKTWAGNDPSTTEPVYAPVRSATATTGLPAYRAITAATSITVPDTATLGTANSVAFRLWAVLFDDGGTARLGIINCAVVTAGASSIYPLAAWQVASSTTVGTGSDSAQVFYTGTGVTSKGYAVLGYATWESGLATAGTWSAGPTRVQAFGLGVPLPGQALQVVNNYNATGSTSNSGSFVDVTNGSAAITPQSAANAVQVDFSWTGSFGIVATTNNIYVSHVLRGATNLSGSSSHRLTVDSSGGGLQVTAGLAFNYLDFPNASSAQTYKVQHAINNTGGTGATTAAISRRVTEIMA